MTKKIKLINGNYGMVRRNKKLISFVHSRLKFKNMKAIYNI